MIYKSTLFINACAREESRTLRLAEAAVERIGGLVDRLDLYAEDLRPLDAAGLAERDTLLARGELSAHAFRYARQFAAADEIVIAAPYWDLSFPSILKCYIEAICVNGVTFCYNENGVPQGLCNARRVTYVTTAGGFLLPGDCGFGYIKQLCNGLFGIGEVTLVKAEGLDIVGADVKGILASAEGKLKDIL